MPNNDNPFHDSDDLSWIDAATWRPGDDELPDLLQELFDQARHLAYQRSLDDCGGDCGYFFLGHKVHHIQARLSWETAGREVEVVDIDGHRAILRFEDGALEVIWHHRPLGERLNIGQSAVRHDHGVLSPGPISVRSESEIVGRTRFTDSSGFEILEPPYGPPA